MAEKPRGEIPQKEEYHFPEREALELKNKYDILIDELNDILRNSDPSKFRPSKFWGYDANKIGHPLDGAEPQNWESFSRDNDEYLRSKAAGLDRLKELLDTKMRELSEVIGALAQLTKDAAEKLEQDKT